MRLLLTAVAALLYLSIHAGADELKIAPLPEGRPAPFDGWLYPREAHKRVAAQLAAADRIVPALEAKAARARAGEDEVRDWLEISLAAEAAATARGDRLAARLEERRGTALQWTGIGLAAAVPVCLEVALDADAEVVIASGLVTAGGALLAAWWFGE